MERKRLLFLIVVCLVAFLVFGLPIIFPTSGSLTVSPQRLLSAIQSTVRGFQQPEVQDRNHSTATSSLDSNATFKHPNLEKRVGNNKAASQLNADTQLQKPLRQFQSSALEAERLLHRLQLHLGENPGPPPQLTDVNCTALISGIQNNASTPNEQRETNSTDKPNNATESQSPTECSLRRVLALTENCTDYVLNSGFLFARVSEEELLFPLAFSLLVYKDLGQVERLLRAVYRPHNVYCVHADRSADDAFHAALRLLVGCLPNVFLLDRVIDVQWGKDTVLEPEVECMRRAVAHRAAWKYFINLTGQEFPLKTNKELVRILKALRGANDITGTTNKIFHFRWENKLPVPYNLTVTKGDVHVLASRAYVDYVTKSPVSRALYEWLRNSFIPDETFFSTLNHNPQLGVSGSYTGPARPDESNYTSIRSYKMWSFGPNSPCDGKWERMICHFGVGDLPRLASSPWLIANKFTYGYQPLAYDCLEKWYFDKVRLENQDPEASLSKLNMSLYAHRDFVQQQYSGPVLIWQ